MGLSMPGTEKIIDIALEEDLGRGDVTTRLTVDPELETVGRVFARQDLVMSGSDVWCQVMQRVDPNVETQTVVVDGNGAIQGDLLMTATGPVGSLLMAERVALNFLQRLCGIATLTREFVRRIPVGCDARIIDTRKTTPGIRNLERQAVRDGGGFNHRVDLSGGVLIKENHITAAGSVERAITLCQAQAPHPLKVEVEVQTIPELEQALNAGAEAVLLDNMSPDTLRQCVELVAGRAYVEASGGVNLDNVEKIARTGVNGISVGALTHSAPAADITFLID
jgi:nicotinate-nucleotide pyrophosphorylase (carboxylating)